MRIAGIIFITLITVTACKANKHHDYTRTNTTTMHTDSITYLALGDSYTIGEAEPLEQSFPYQLTALLKAAGIKAQNPDIIAVTGWTTDDLISAIQSNNLPTKHYDVVTLLVGVNDQYQSLSRSNYRIKFEQVLKTAISYAGGDASRVFVLSIPDYGVTPFANGNDSVIGPQIDQFNAINKEISTHAGVHYLDITPISRQAASNSGLIASDGLHPSAEMYGLWVKQLEPVVITRLKEK